MMSQLLLNVSRSIYFSRHQISLQVGNFPELLSPSAAVPGTNLPLRADQTGTSTTSEKMRIPERELLARFTTLTQSKSITVLIPARNEEATVGEIVCKLVDRYHFDSTRLFRVIVIDDHSTDNTAAIAAKAGAEVIVRDDPGHATGKAETIAAGIDRFPSDIYVLFDADVSNFDAIWLEKLCYPLSENDVILSKATYERPVKAGWDNHDGFLEGGRVTELVARPLLSMFFPEVARFGQPLSGEVAFKAELARSAPLSAGYGFDVGLLLDSYLMYGINSITEIELGERTHRHQELTALSFQASQVASTILMKAGIDVEALPGARRLIRPGRPDKSVPIGLLKSPRST